MIIKRQDGLEYKVGSLVRLPRGPDGLIDGYEWVTMTDSRGDRHRVQVPRDWGKAKPAAASKFSPEATRPIRQPQLPNDLELLKSGQERYAVIPLRYVDGAACSAAWRMAKAASRELGFEFVPSIRWIARRGDPSWQPCADDQVAGAIDVKGFVNPDSPSVIHVRADLPVDEVAAVVAHELRHAWQVKHHGVLVKSTYRHEPGPWEDDAHEFMYQLLSRADAAGGR